MLSLSTTVVVQAYFLREKKGAEPLRAGVRDSADRKQMSSWIDQCTSAMTADRNGESTSDKC